MRTLFRTFCHAHPYFTMEAMIDYFSLVGGIEDEVALDYFETLEAMVDANFVQHFSRYEASFRPSYLMESPYREILIAIAQGDGKYYSVLRKARIRESVGKALIDTLIDLGIIRIEVSREAPLKQHPKQKLKKTLRRYRIQDKLRFQRPFLRFWFGFVMPYHAELRQGKSNRFFAYFSQHHERLRTLVFEELSNALLMQHFSKTTPLLSYGSYWNRESEFDILAITSKDKIILGECKYKARKVCKSELTKLQTKAKQAGIRADIYALFSKDGFSNELHTMESETLLLFDLDALYGLCH